jgi:DNA-binding CsgD family transcriptional regulator
MCSDHGNYQATNGSGGIPNFAKRDNTSLYPTPAQARTLSMFIEGKSTEEIASTMGIKRATVQWVLPVCMRGS